MAASLLGAGFAGTANADPGTCNNSIKYCGNNSGDGPDNGDPVSEKCLGAAAIGGATGSYYGPPGAAVTGGGAAAQCVYGETVD